MAGKSLGTLTIGIVADIGAYAKGIDQAMTKTTEFQKSLDKSLGVIDNSYSKSMSAMAKFYQNQDATQTKAIQALALNTNSFEGLMLRREAALKKLDAIFSESERTSKEYIAAQSGIENSYTQGVMRLKALGLGMEQTGNKTRLARHEMLNFGYQINDVVVSLASGQRPLTVFAQQGVQIGQIAASSGVGVKGLALALGDMAKAAGRATAAFALNPYFLAFAAVVGSATLAIKAFKDEINDDAGFDAYIKSLNLSAEQTDVLNKELEDLGGTTVTTGDLFKAFFQVMDDYFGTTETFETWKKTIISGFDDIVREGTYGMAWWYATAKATKQTMDDIKNPDVSLGDIFNPNEQYRKNFNKYLNEFYQFGKDVEDAATGIRKDLIDNAINPVLEKDIQSMRSSLDNMTASTLKGMDKIRYERAKDNAELNKYIDKLKTLRRGNLTENDWSDIREKSATIQLKYQQAVSDYNEKQQKQNERLRKQAEKAAKEEQKRPDYIKSINLELDNEIARAGMLNEAKEREARLDKISETLSKKKFAQLSDKEKKTIEDKVAALEKEEKKQKAVDALYSGSSKRAVEEYTIQQAALLTALQKGYITQEEYQESLYGFREAYKAATDAIYPFQKSLEETRRTYGVFGDELTIMKALTPEVMSGLTEGQIEAAKQSIYLEEALKRVNNELQKIWSDTKGTDETIAARIKALQEAFAGIGEIKITQGYYDVGMQDVKASQNQSKFTKAGASSIYSETSGQYDELIKKELEWKNARESGLVTVTQYENAMRDLHSQQLQLDALNGKMESPFDAFSSGLELYASSFKGTFAELQSIGQSFSQSLGDGISDAFARSIVQGDSFKESLHSLSETILTELISSLIRATIQAAIFRAILTGVSFGGLFGAGGSPVSMAGSGGLAYATAATGGFVVGKGTSTSDSNPFMLSNGEFVVNASATAKNRPYIEAMNNGASFNDLAKPNATNLNFQIINQAPGVQVRQETLSSGDVRLIVQQEMAQNTDKYTAAALEKQYSRSRSAMLRTTKTARKL